MGKKKTNLWHRALVILVLKIAFVIGNTKKERNTDKKTYGFINIMHLIDQIQPHDQWGDHSVI